MGLGHGHGDRLRDRNDGGDAAVSSECQNETVVGVHYYVCGTTWFRPYAGNNGLYYKVVAAPR